MKKGQIIRKMSNDGTPYGAFLMIDRATSTKVDAHPINPVSNLTVTLDKEHVYECYTVLLDAPARDIVRIVENDSTEYYHEPTKTWEKASHYNWDIVILQNKAAHAKVYYTDCEVKRVMKRVPQGIGKLTKHVPIIRVTLGKIIHYETQ